mmetsp:Transcript_23023/g.38058  ORF Transcript_23023/g.38058 Transcript_23023/m.38058 type:complete len:289 (+) Transcript_23023:64-930(+)|eukprot:CAMPEP_0119004282 /NCGR_PEP_ID=MMETSP1176-20130426/1056_1 /TAXON_ID=265551 /ORGANISM="Synedropsis recta cf, Strain CCMP1620" /LENGTH=288 /DNA_ID=CAMNT_0006955969 /DNA_START=45 /DNA_END=911 /DNA_ORIENTATION=+
MMVSFRAIGNSLHVVNILNIALYGLLLYKYGNDANAGVVFDEEWLKEGFCLPHEERNFRTTHDLSGYLMVALASMGFLIHGYLRHQAEKEGRNTSMAPADQLTFWALIGALGHAAGHFIISNAKRHEFYPPSDERFIDDLMRSTLPEAIMKAGPGYPLFWIPLVKTYMMNTARDRVALLALVFQFGIFFVPVKFAFSYTQAVLFGGMSIDQLLMGRKEKGFEYAFWPLLTVIPNSIFAWVESTTCTSGFVMKHHGHIVYDFYMVSSYIVFYVVCWIRMKYFVTKQKSM